MHTKLFVILKSHSYSFSTTLQDPTATIIVTKKGTHVITDGTATITKRKGGAPGAGGVPPTAAGSSKLDDIRKRLDRLKAGQY